MGEDVKTTHLSEKKQGDLFRASYTARVIHHSCIWQECRVGKLCGGRKGRFGCLLIGASAQGGWRLANQKQGVFTLGLRSILDLLWLVLNWEQGLKNMKSANHWLIPDHAGLVAGGWGFASWIGCCTACGSEFYCHICCDHCLYIQFFRSPNFGLEAAWTQSWDGW